MAELITLTVPNHDATADDAVVWGFAFSDTSTGTAGLGWVEDLFSHNYGTHSLQNWLASCLDWANAVVRQYDITGHLDGSPHGSPYGITTGGFAASTTVFGSAGNQAAAVVGYQTSNYATTPTVTGTGTVPTPEAAQDMGAPATHMGNLLGKARKSGRLFLGPVPIDMIAHDGSFNPILTTPFLTDASAAFAAAKSGGAADHGLHWGVWSRRDAAINTVGQGWVDHCVKTRRSREFINHGRTTY